jgi:hypothetical protein
MSSAAIAVTISFWTSRERWAFLLISVVFAYTTFSDIVQRPEGIKIAGIFIALIIASSLISRAFRSTELRIREVVLDDASREFLSQDRDQVIRLISHRPAVRSVEEYDARDALARWRIISLPTNSCSFWKLTRSSARTDARNPQRSFEFRRIQFFTTAWPIPISGPVHI